MIELLQACFSVDGEIGDRWYQVNLRWSSGVAEHAVILEREFPQKAQQIQDLIDTTKEMTVSERLNYIAQHVKGVT